VTREGSEVLFAVRDTGRGIAASELPHIFDEFFQGPRAEGGKTAGTGLGLTVSRHLAEMLGGSIRAESEQGHGSVFTLRLPLDGPSA
jgi:two-component system sensor histidine kinase BaeS